MPVAKHLHNENKTKHLAMTTETTINNSNNDIYQTAVGRASQRILTESTLGTRFKRRKLKSTTTTTTTTTTKFVDGDFFV
jgi:hypothetical protein